MVRPAAVLFAAAALLAASACSDASGPSEAPPGHTVRRDGVWHAPGLEEPAENCAECHGADLRGRGDAPSCFRCHGEVWS